MERLQRVEGLDGTAGTAARGNDPGVAGSGGAVERQDAVSEIVGEHGLGRRDQSRAPPAFGERGDPVENLRLVDARGAERCTGLSRNPVT